MPSLINERNLPTNWTVKRFKYCAQICNGGEYSDIEVEEGGYPVIGSGGEFARASQFSYCGKSVLLGRKGTVDKPLFVDSAFWCVDTMFYTKIYDFMYEKYLYYCALCFPFDYYVTSTALPSMTQRDLGSQEIAVPPRKEQQAIADFLDKECVQIDSIIADLEKQIELLQQYKKSLITETVTKGLDKSVPMKDSGVEWIGEIPEHWKVYRIKNVLNILTDYTANGSFKDLADNVEYLDFESYARVIRLTDLRVNMQNYGIYVDEHAYNYLQKSALFGGETLIANVGAYAGLFCEMPTIQYKATLGPNMYMMITDPKLLLQHYFYLLGQSKSVRDQLLIKATASAQPKLNKMDVKSVYIAIPPVSEQYKISGFLDSKISVIDETIDVKYQQLEAIRQHKNSLIYEYVTGKKRVKEVQ